MERQIFRTADIAELKIVGFCHDLPGMQTSTVGQPEFHKMNPDKSSCHSIDI
jgi:hypothetical protein